MQAVSNRKFVILGMLLAVAVCGTTRAETISVAVAANMKSAFTELEKDFERAHPGDSLEVTYGSSGKFAAQIANGAPFAMFFSADTVYPRELVGKGLTVGAARPYAVGHLVLWSLRPELGNLDLKQLPNAAIHKFAIANPATAPYGQRAREALQREGVWDAMQPKLVLGESIAQTAQFIDTGAADAGIVALSLVLGPELSGKGSWYRIPDKWHQPLEQSFVILKRAERSALTKAFADYMMTRPARSILKQYGFDAPR